MERRNVAAIVTVMCGAAVGTYAGLHLLARPLHTSKLSGNEWVQELLTGHKQHIKDQLGVAGHVFRALQQMLRKDGGISDTKHVTVDEQLAVFLYALVTGLSNRKLQERFQKPGV